MSVNIRSTVEKNIERSFYKSVYSIECQQESGHSVQSKLSLYK